MDNTPRLLFEYLKNIIYSPDKAKIDKNELNADFYPLADGLAYLLKLLNEQRELSTALAKGDLSTALPPPGNELAAPLKSLHASLRHMTWQSQQVAMGDYKQRIDFMGEFSDAFNTMVAQLEARQRSLEQEIAIGIEKTKALEQGSKMLEDITSNLPQIILVLNAETGDLLYKNKAADITMSSDPGLLHDVQKLSGNPAMVRSGADLERDFGAYSNYYTANMYEINWNNTKAAAFVLHNISTERRQLQELEIFAYYDPLTNLYNRLYGMKELELLLKNKAHFILCFVDLDNLKYVNDSFGHNEGDIYIKMAAEILCKFDERAIVCRIGGDEFMILCTDISYQDALERMDKMYKEMRRRTAKDQKLYGCNLSFGVVEVFPDSNYSSNLVLSIADERMYEFKRHNKMKKRRALGIEPTVDV